MRRRTAAWRWLVFALALSLLCLLRNNAAAQPPAPPPDSGSSTVQPGDNLYTLAERYFERTADYALVQRLNRVADPRRLPPGRILAIPRRRLRHAPIAAVIAAARGDVRIVSGTDARPALAGARVHEADVIVTGADAFVTLRLPDGARVSLPSQSRIAVRRLRRTLMTGAVERAFLLLDGRARAVVPPASGPADDFRISTPAAVSAVRGTEFRVRYDPAAARGTTEVLEGVVAFSAANRGAPVDLAAGYGAQATPDAAGAPAALLPPPPLEQPGAVQAEPDLAFRIAPQAGAAAYRLQIAADAGFVDVAADTLSPDARIALAALPDGTWFVRASAIDAGGLEGLPATYTFRRRLQHIAGSAEARRTGRGAEYLFRWIAEGEGTPRFRFQLLRDGVEAPPVVDLIDLAQDHVTITDLEPGRYVWRVMSSVHEEGEIHSRWSPMERLTVSPGG